MGGPTRDMARVHIIRACLESPRPPPTAALSDSRRSAPAPGTAQIARGRGKTRHVR
jgi:hypothetical protein